MLKENRLIILKVQKKERGKENSWWMWRGEGEMGARWRRWGRGGGWMRDMGTDAQINYSLHSSILSCQLPFIEAVRCPLRMAGEEKCHSCQRVKRKKRAAEKKRGGKLSCRRRALKEKTVRNHTEWIIVIRPDQEAHGTNRKYIIYYLYAVWVFW